MKTLKAALLGVSLACLASSALAANSVPFPDNPSDPEIACSNYAADAVAHQKATLARELEQINEQRKHLKPWESLEVHLAPTPDYAALYTQSKNICIEPEQRGYDLAKYQWDDLSQQHAEECLAFATKGIPPFERYQALGGCTSTWARYDRSTVPHTFNKW